ncbi:MAG: thiolase family protein [Planctomycetes bacterium]|nr:thiolase family protein [Planctomycetota bacterium]
MKIAVVDGVRTPIGKFGGALKDLKAQDISKIVVFELIRKMQLDKSKVDEVILGCCGQSSDAPNIARIAALKAGLGLEVPAYTVMRNCASGIQAATSAFQSILAKDSEAVIIGGVESMSNIPFVNRDIRFGKGLQNSLLIDSLWEGLTDPICNQIMGKTAENIVEKYGISREEQDKYAAESHKKAFKAIRSGRFKHETVQIEVSKKAFGREVAKEKFVEDECVNVSLNVQTLSMLPPIFKENGTVTGGNSCPISDGGGALLVMSDEKAKSMGYAPLGYIKSYAYVGLEPSLMGLGPIYAVRKVLKKTGMNISDFDAIEINEAFAAQVIACVRELNIDIAKLNPNGGAIALGHPVGFTGARLILTALYELKLQNKSLALVTLCVGGGQGAAVVLERA